MSEVRDVVFQPYRKEKKWEERNDVTVTWHATGEIRLSLVTRVALTVLKRDISSANAETIRKAFVQC